jgi:hypothetical protein
MEDDHLAIGGSREHPVLADSGAEAAGQSSGEAARHVLLAPFDLANRGYIWTAFNAK